MNMRWHILTGEYPPRLGGVADYSRLVAEGLASAGDEVHVWTPASGAESSNGSVAVHQLPGHFGPHALRILSRSIDASPGRVLVQYVPHAFGFRAMNLLFCLWLLRNRRARIDLMFHEVAFPFRRDQSVRRHLLALTHRLMAIVITRSAERTFVSTPAWIPMLRRLAGNRRFEWLPVPNNIPVVADTGHVASIRRHYLRRRILIGHFGTFGAEVGQLLDASLAEALTRCDDADALLLGRSSDVFLARWQAVRGSSFAGRISATGALDARELSQAISACDILVQPYPGGANSRRGSLMAGLAHGRPVVSNRGEQTESVWTESRALIVPDSSAPTAIADAVARLVADEDERIRIGAAARELYSQRFDLKHTIRGLRFGVVPPVSITDRFGKRHEALRVDAARR
jgi:glycosyltransferase involved in cell wall biosynthesis